MTAAELLGFVRVAAIAVCWSRFAAGTLPAFADGPLALGLGVAFWLFSIPAFLGIHGRPFTLLTGLVCFGMYYGLGVYGPVHALDSHHVYAQALVTCLIALLPIDRAVALRPSQGPVSLDLQWVLRLQICVLYLGGVYEKSYPAWLDGTRLEQILYAIYLGSDAVDLGAWRWGLTGAAWAVWASELFLAVGVWFPRAWRWMFALAFALHAGIYLATPVATFSATMFVFWLAVAPPDLLSELLPVRSPSTSWPWWSILPLLAGPVLVPVRAFDGLALTACDLDPCEGPQTSGMCAASNGWEAVVRACPIPPDRRRRSAW